MIVIYTIISLVSLLIVWELAARFTGASMFLPPASQVLAAFFRSFVEPIGKRTMLAHVGVSLYRVAVAFFFATIAGIALGVGMGYSASGMDSPVHLVVWAWRYRKILHYFFRMLLFHYGKHL